MHSTAQGQLVFDENDQGPMPTYPPHSQRWHKLLDEYPYLRVLDGWQCLEGPPPRPLDRDQLLALLGTLLYEPHRQVLAELLLDVLAPGIVAVVQALDDQEAA
jgi:hypothetical protein